MSHPVNSQWLEAAWENFEEAVSQRNYPLALDVIADIRDAGFATEADNLHKHLLEHPVSQFIGPSPYPAI